MDLYPNLIWLYHTMVASERLLEAAGDEATGELRKYFWRHLEEEWGHAQWLMEDLASVGITVRNTVIPREVVEMVGSIYYLVFHVEPCALLGYMQVLEAGTQQIDMARLERDYPASVLRTLKHHVAHDPAHLKELEAVIDTCTAEQKKLIAQTAQQTREYLVRIAQTYRKAS